MNMFSKLEQRLSRAARDRQRAIISRLSSILGHELPHVQVEVESDRLILSGRRLHSRWLREPALRFIAGLLR